MAANKIVFGNKVLIDLTSDTVSASNLLKGFKAHDKTGMRIIGTYEAEELIGNILENGFASGDITYEETTDTITATNNTTGQVLTKRFSGNKVIVELTQSNLVVGTLVRTYDEDYTTITSVNSYTGLTTIKTFDYEKQKVTIVTQNSSGQTIKSITKHF